MAQLLLNKRILVAATLIAVGVAAFFVLRPGEPMPPASDENAPAVLSGAITGLPSQSSDSDSRTAFLWIIDPNTLLVVFLEQVGGSAASYRIETSPGARMAFLKVWDRDSGKLYTGTSGAFVISAGETRTVDIDVEETSVQSSGPIKTRALSSLTRSRNVFEAAKAIFRTARAHAANDKPAISIVSPDVPPETWDTEIFWPKIESDIFNILKDHDRDSIASDLTRSFAEQVDYEYTNVEKFDPATRHGDFKPIAPNFIIKIEGDVEHKPLYPNSPRLETYAVTKVKISLLDATNGNVIVTDESSDTFQIPEVVAKRLVEKFVPRIFGEGPDAIELPEFTPSVSTPTKELPSEWVARIRKQAGLDKPSETGTGETPSPAVGTGETSGSGSGAQSKSGQSQQPQQPATAPCDIPAFQACANTFSLQGCIDACPYVPTECPAGTSPGTECKKTDQACSDQCWATADAHLASCLQSSHCTQEQVVAGGGGATR